MAALAWWAIPVTATLLAIGWAGWVSRPRPPQKMIDCVESYEKFRLVMEGQQRAAEETRRAHRAR